MEKRNFKVGQICEYEGRTFKIVGFKGDKVLTKGYGENPNDYPFMQEGSWRYNKCKVIDREPEFKITIEFENGNTKAKLKKNGKVVKEAEARLHPNDEFDMKTGANLCIERLFEKKKEFKPYLAFFDDEFMGYIGTETNLVDIAGNHLKVGDVVRMFDLKSNEEEEETIVVESNECNNKFEIIGLFGRKSRNGVYDDEIAILKADNYEIEDGDSIRYVTFHLKEGQE